MYCPNCKQEFDGNFCPECGTKFYVAVHRLNVAQEAINGALSDPLPAGCIGATD